MHSIGKYKTGCTYYGSACRKKHERPSIEPPKKDDKRVSTTATGATPKRSGDKQVITEMQVSDVQDTKC